MPARTRAALSGHDLLLTAAGTTFYAALAVVPLLVVAIRSASWVLGPQQVRRFAGSTGASLPSALGADQIPPTLAAAALELNPLLVLVAVLPASLYGEGLRRSFATLSGVPEQASGWRGRLAPVPVLLVAPFLLMGVLASTPLLAELRGSTLASTLLGSYVALNVGWVVVSLPLTWAFRGIAPRTPSWRLSLVGGFTTGAFVSGFLQGFVLFLSLPIDLAAPFGGIDVVGATCALLLWVWVLHIVVLVGYVATCTLEELLHPAAA